jgi:hypothetical protein
MSHALNIPVSMNQIFLDSLRQAPSDELYRLYLIVGKMLYDPQRTQQMRQSLRLGVIVGYLADDPFGAARQGRVVELRATQAVIEDLNSCQRRAVRYAAILLDGSLSESKLETTTQRVNPDGSLVGDSSRAGVVIRMGCHPLR